jgi:3-oxoacyl-[acyl-carrier-protein] synthase-3
VALGSRIAGTGSYVPAKVLTNFDLEGLVDTSDAWITERTGIKERRIAADDETTSDMALHASRNALAAAGLSPNELDMIVLGTVTPDQQLPACAAYLQQKLGVTRIPAFDIAAACAGFIYGLSIADQFIRTGMHRHVLVVGAELLSRVTNWEDRNTCVLFGDGAGAVVVSAIDDDVGGRLLSSKLHTDSTLTESLCIPAGGVREPTTPEGLAQHRNKVAMIGGDIFKIAVKNLTSASRSAIEEAGISADDVDWVVPHQANMRIITQVSARLGIPLDRFILNIDRFGNTSSASIPLALDEGVRDGRVKSGQTVLMCALGAGISWGSALVRL